MTAATNAIPPLPAFDGRAVINGHRVSAMDGQTFECISPVDGRVLTSVARCGQADIDHAVATARAAFDSRRWSGMAPAQRKRIMIKFADQILAHADELALTETLDMGKPIQYAKGVDVNSAANCIRWYGEAVDKVYDEIAPTPRTGLALITREPVGVVGIIVPWNYPMIMAAWKIAPALAAGNSVVLKPSEKSPLTALRLAELALAAGMPPGVFNVVPGYGPEAGSPLALHMDVDCIAFTGSTRVGKQIPCDGRAKQPQARLDRAGRQVAQHRVRRLPQPGQGRGRRGGQHLFQPGRKLQRALAPVCGRKHQRRLP
jgi:acyl-CoA reductase-like NAD-dependent aldehyde dehydrogenase